VSKRQPVWIVVSATLQIIPIFLLPPALLLAPMVFLRLLGLALPTLSALILYHVNQPQMQSSLEARLTSSCIT
jgi:hypothetical protein